MSAALALGLSLAALLGVYLIKLLARDHHQSLLSCYGLGAAAAIAAIVSNPSSPWWAAVLAMVPGALAGLHLRAFNAAAGPVTGPNADGGTYRFTPDDWRTLSLSYAALSLTGLGLSAVVVLLLGALGWFLGQPTLPAAAAGALAALFLAAAVRTLLWRTA